MQAAKMKAVSVENSWRATALTTLHADNVNLISTG